MMFEDSKKTAIAVLAVVFVAGALVMMRMAYNQHEALATAAQTAAVAEARIAFLEDARKQAVAADAAQQKAAQAAQADVRNTAQAVRTIIQYVPVPQTSGQPVPTAPQTTVIQKADLSAAEQAKVPDSPSYALQTQEAAVATARTLIQCKADQTSLNSCAAQLSTVALEREAYKGEAAAWEKAAKGGSKAKRFLKFAACAAAGAGGGFAGAAKSPGYAAAGAAAGFGACHILF